MKFNDEELTKAFTYLDGLREFGSTNMLGAAQDVMRKFNWEYTQASQVLKLWMKTFKAYDFMQARVDEARRLLISNNDK